MKKIELKKYKKQIEILSVVSLVFAGCFLLSWFFDGMIWVNYTTGGSFQFEFWKAYSWLLKTSAIIGWIAVSIYGIEYND
jgi:hypothetical protein